ncbi:MAG: glycosyltransferase, partial [Thermoleophilia bacterium]|nr:glycosyltransferase [Thermoleophilia bacterium]
MTRDFSSNSRFRTGHVQAPTTPDEHLEGALGDGERLFELFAEHAADAVRAGDAAAVTRLARVAGRTDDVHRAYMVHRHAAALLFGAATASPHDDSYGWATWIDQMVALLVPVLEETPHEPELLDMLGLASYELGHTSHARRLFEAVRTIEPTHERARAHLRACKERAKRGVGSLPTVPEQHSPEFTRSRTRVKEIAERATRLQDRTISLCMIVKDEEEMLPGCLAAVAEHVDQIVIVDTGSTDRTREIAEEYGALVVDFAWNGSFADARNQTLPHATGDWILWLDADEHVVAGDGPQLREMARRTWFEGISLIETHFTGEAEGGGETTHTPMRLFRNRSEYGWRGRVHEQLMWAMPTYLPERFGSSALRVNHFGYLATVIDERDKHERNLTLLMEQVAEERSAFTCFNIGTEHAAIFQFDEAVRWFDEALVMARSEPEWQQQQYAPMLVQRTIVARRCVGDLDRALDLSIEAAQWWPTFTDLVYERAITSLAKGDFAATVTHARVAIEMGDAPARFVATTGKGSFQARNLLATALRNLGDAVGAREQLEASIAEAPHFIASVSDLTELLLEDGDAASASTTIDELLGSRAHGAAANLPVAAVFHEAGAFDVADERYGRVLAATPGHGAALVARAELRLAQDDPVGALELALAVDPLDRMAGRSGRTAFLAAVVLGGDAELLAEPARRLADSPELAASERATYVAWHERLVPSEQPVHVLVPADGASAATVFSNLDALAKLSAVEAFEVLHPLATLAVPDERLRRLQFAEMYLRRRFADMAGEEFMICAQEFGPDAQILRGLGKVATMKELWEDAEVFLSESLKLDPTQRDVVGLLTAI